MDLLGSIMSKMEQPPSTSTQAQREAKKKEQELQRKHKEREKERILRFKQQIEKEVTEFLEDDSLQKKALAPMNEIQRSIVHEAAETAGVTCHAFGEESVDRHIVLFKADYDLSEAELAALRRGDCFDPVQYRQHMFERDLQQRLDEQRQSAPSGGTTGKRSIQQPASFLQKRRHLVGSGDASPLCPSAVNSQFGVVSSRLKTDKRSIEETLADIRAKKRRAEIVDNSVECVVNAADSVPDENI